MTILVKRVYEDPAPGDGQRVLVDRLWPRGVSKERAALDDWLKEVAPSDDLRKWYHQHSGEWEEFVRRYNDELDTRADAVEQLLRRARQGTLTLVYSSKETERNNAVALRDYLERNLE
jgi:uncharacterized protein YeaO (DUF488 family)